LDTRCSELSKRVLAGNLVEFELIGVVAITFCSAVIAFGVFDLICKVRFQLLLSDGLHLSLDTTLI